MILGPHAATARGMSTGEISSWSWLLCLAQGLASSIPTAENLDNTLDALHWALCCCLSATRHLNAPDWNGGLGALAASTAVTIALAPWAQPELQTALEILHCAPEPRVLFEAVLAAVASKVEAHGGALVGVMGLLGGMVRLYTVEKQKFISSLQSLPESQGEVPKQSLGATGIAAGTAGAGDAANGGYLKAEEERQRLQVAGQRFLDELLSSEESAPACFIPWLLNFLACPEADPKEQVKQAS